MTTKAPQLTSERLDYVPFEESHLDYLHLLWTNPEVRRYLWDDEVITLDTASSVIDASRDSFRNHGFGFWVLNRSSGGPPVGFAGFRHFGDDDEIEILYGLAPNFWRKGLATEAARCLLDFAFDELGLDEIFAGADPPNKASFRVMQRLGFGFHSSRVLDGVPSEYYSITRSQWDSE